MARLLWGESYQRRYEAGIDRGVLYPTDGPGVPWSGLVSVDEDSLENEKTPYYLDGVKYNESAKPRHFQAAITAFSAPDQFDECIGERSVVPGFVLTRQSRKRFALSYRTLIGSDGDYKIHLVYNATAYLTSRTTKTRDESSDVPTLSWTVDAVPPFSTLFKPSAHFVLDSTKVDPDALEVIESVLYGTFDRDPRMLEVEEVLGLAGFWTPLVITENQTTSYATLTDGLGDVYRTVTPGILHILPNSRLAPTGLDSGLYRME